MQNALRATLIVAATFVLAGCSLPWPGSDPASNNPSTNDHQAALRFAECMRDHGLADFPDPSTSNGGFAINGGPGSDLDPSSKTFKDASTACQKYLPSGGAKNGKADPQMQQKALKFSKCMRDHGITDFPDPKFDSNGGGGMQIQLNPDQAGSDLDPNSPQFQAAQQACASIIGLPKGGTTNTSSGTGSGGGPVTSGR